MSVVCKFDLRWLYCAGSGSCIGPTLVKWHMNIKPIKTERDYEAALARVMELMDAKADTLEGDELDILGTLVEAYESRNFAIDKPNPVEAIRFRMEQYGIKDKDLVP